MWLLDMTSFDRYHMKSCQIKIKIWMYITPYGFQFLAAENKRQKKQAL